MNKLVSVMICLVLTFGSATAETVLDESTVRAISEELRQAATSGDLAVIKKYLYPGSKIVADLDPAEDAGETELSYDDYINLLELTLPFMENADIHDEVLSVSIDDARNQATIREKTSVTVEIMGTKVRDVSISETTYGIIDGQIKALVSTDELLSSEVIE